MLPEVGLLLAGLSLVSGFIIPEELPSLLSLLYSNIPPVKKGTDSRVGFGFKLGPHADFQVMLEIGPQTNTAPIGPNAQPQGKRQTLQMENTDTLVDMVNHWKMPLPTEEPTQDIEIMNNIDNEVDGETNKNNEASNSSTSSTAWKWLDSWKNTFSRGSYFGKIKFKPVPGIDDRRDVIPQPSRPRRLSFVDKLTKLYNQRSRGA